MLTEKGLLKKLKELKKSDQWVFTNDNGRQLDQHIRDRFQKICKNLVLINLYISGS